MTDCPECGSGRLLVIDGYYKCDSCDFTLPESEMHVVSAFGDFDDYGDDEPEGCAACGGDYPNCTTSCSLFDD